MIISKTYNDELTGFIQIVRLNLYEAMKGVNAKMLKMSFIIPVNDEFIIKYNLNSDFVFVADMSDWDDISVEIYYKGGKFEPKGYWLKPNNWTEPYLLDSFQECIKQDTHVPDITHLETRSLKELRTEKLKNIKL